MAKYTYETLLDEIKPSLETLGSLSYGDKTPVSHHLKIAENLSLIEDKAKIFLDTREKLIEDYVEKDKDGNPKKQTKEGGIVEYVLTDENRIAWQEKFEELRQEEVEVKLNKIEKKHFEGAKELKPIYLKGIWSLLK